MWSGDAELNTRFSEFAAVGIHLLFGIEMLDRCRASVTGLAAWQVCVCEAVDGLQLLALAILHTFLWMYS